MSNFHSYQSYQGPTQAVEAEPRPAIRIDADAGRTTRATFVDGQLREESFSVEQFKSSEMNPHYQDGTVFETAQNVNSFGVTEITPETLITINGVQAPVKFWEGEGFVHKGADGQYREGPGDAAEDQPEAQPEDNADQLSMPPDVVAAVDGAIEGVSDHHIDPLIAFGLGAATGELDASAFEARFMQYSGANAQEAAVKASLIFSAYQAQADAALTERGGIAREDLPGFYEWAKDTQKGALRGAIERQIRSSDFGGLRALASRYLSEMPPTLEAVQAGGYQTRTLGDMPEVLIDGRWMTINTAARLGYF